MYSLSTSDVHEPPNFCSCSQLCGLQWRDGQVLCNACQHSLESLRGFPPKALPLDSKVILGKLFCLIFHESETDLPMQRISLPMLTKPGKRVNNINGFIQNWIYQSSWSELPSTPQKSLPSSTPGLPMCTVVNHPSEFGYFVMHTNWGMCWWPTVLFMGASCN